MRGKQIRFKRRRFRDGFRARKRLAVRGAGLARLAVLSLFARYFAGLLAASLISAHSLEQRRSRFSGETSR